MRKAEVFGFGGALILIALYFVLTSLQTPYSSIQGLLIGAFIGFFGFFLLGYAMYGDEETPKKSF